MGGRYEAFDGYLQALNVVPVDECKIRLVEFR
jgi:hypothetical protein